ncbi:MAG: hypothetical protein C4524_12640 [Candidatus Zixiibacteriota bacterium]|nr:MAG: hypothetical protein C4524_12640 [candidate division Zixibacteria bacterium]
MVEMLGAAIIAMPVFMPLRMSASVVLGEAALADMSLGLAALAGVITHLALAAFFGLLYGLINARLSPAVQAHSERQAVMGLGYGLLIWLINFQIIARAAYPWFLETSQWLHALVHALAYGLPLGLMYAENAQRAEYRRAFPRPRRRKASELESGG